MYNYEQYAKTYPQYFMLHKALPKGYTQLKYITATRKQYIDTELSIEVGDIFNVQFTSNGDRRNSIITVYGNGIAQLGYKVGEGFIVVGYIAIEKITGQKRFNVSAVALEGIDGTLTICKSLINNNGIFSGDIYNLNVVRRGKIIIYLIPCLDNNGVACLYDIINEKTYYSNSNIPFEKGE